MILLAISGKLLLTLIGSGVIVFVILAMTISHKIKSTSVYGTVSKIEPPQAEGDDYTTIVLWNQDGSNKYRVYIRTLDRVKAGSNIGMHKKNFESIYFIDYVEEKN